MKIDHIAIWVKDLELVKDFYTRWFSGTSGELYTNPAKNFRSYFLNFEEGCRLEIMQRPSVPDDLQKEEKSGFTHLAFSVGSKEAVDLLTEKLREQGIRIVGEPRFTGDGYYESVVLDPENNRIEITE